MPPLSRLLLSLLLCGAWYLGQGGLTHVRAGLAQVLLRSAWAGVLASGQPVRAWPWADSWPVARLRVPRLHLSRIVLAGANGATLAFGPGRLLTGAAGAGVVLAGYRDTHFAFLRHLQTGDALELQQADGRWRHYRVREITILAQWEVYWLERMGPSDLVLVTCYPFQAIRPGGPLRYLVWAEAADDGPEEHQTRAGGGGPGGPLRHRL